MGPPALGEAPTELDGGVAAPDGDGVVLLAMTLMASF